MRAEQYLNPIRTSIIPDSFFSALLVPDEDVQDGYLSRDNKKRWYLIHAEAFNQLGVSAGAERKI